MSREEHILNNLFEQARNEQVETNVNDVRKWIGLVTLGTVLAGLLTKLKVIITKSAAMYTTVILTAGIGLGSYFLSGTDKNEGQNTPVDNVKIATEQEIIVEEQPLDTAFSMPEKERKIQNYVSEVTDEPEKELEYPPVLPLTKPFQEETNASQLLTIHLGNEDNYGPFTSVKVSGALEVYLQTGAKESVRVEAADEDDKKILVIQNKNKTLGISMNGKMKMRTKIKVYITVVDLEKVECSGAVDLYSIGELKLNDFELKVSGASDVDMDVIANELTLAVSGASDVDLAINAVSVKVNLSGASDVVLSGTVSTFDLICTGASDLKAEKLKIKEGNVNVSGASLAKLHVTGKLDLIVSGASDVKYRGNPSIGTKTVSGAAKVRQF